MLLTCVTCDIHYKNKSNNKVNIPWIIISVIDNKKYSNISFKMTEEIIKKRRIT